MVLPYTVYLQTAAGDALLFKAQLFHYTQAFCIAGHHIAFDAVQLQHFEGKVTDLLHRLGGVSHPLIFFIHLVGQKTAFHTAKQYAADADGADDGVVPLFGNPEAEFLTFPAQFVIVFKVCPHAAEGIKITASLWLGVGKCRFVAVVKIAHPVAEFGVA